MNFFDVLAEMLVILFAIAAGYGANRLGYLGGETDQKLSKLILNITMPAMIVAAVITGEKLPEISVILSILEVAVALYGDGALFYAAILALPFNLLSYSLGPLMLAGAGRFHWRQLLSPCIVASVLGLVLALTRLRPPAIVGEMLDFVGSITVPLSLLVVGSLLAHMSPGKVLRSPKLWVLSVLRLLVMPAFLGLVLRGMHIEAMVLGIAVSQMGMPVAVNGTLLSMEYGGDTEAMAQVTFLTTLGAIVTIPVLAAVLL